MRGFNHKSNCDWMYMLSIQQNILTHKSGALLLSTYTLTKKPCIHSQLVCCEYIGLFCWVLTRVGLFCWVLQGSFVEYLYTNKRALYSLTIGVFRIHRALLLSTHKSGALLLGITGLFSWVSWVNAALENGVRLLQRCLCCQVCGTNTRDMLWGLHDKRVRHDVDLCET